MNGTVAQELALILNFRKKPQLIAVFNFPTSRLYFQKNTKNVEFIIYSLLYDQNFFIFFSELLKRKPIYCIII